MKKVNLNLGCGFDAPKEWENYDSSPSVLVQSNPILNFMFGRFIRTKFPKNVKYMNLKTAKFEPNSVDAIYLSHVLEHFSYIDAVKILRKLYCALKPGGYIRVVVPDLRFLAQEYLTGVKQTEIARIINGNDSLAFVMQLNMGNINPPTFKERILSLFGSSKHQWMYDFYGLIDVMKAGKFEYSKMSNGIYKMSKYSDFSKVERKERFINSICIEAVK